MELKQQVLKILEENRGESVNGAKLAGELYVTRSAIWKAVKSLQKDGYRIVAVTNKGYSLLPQNDIVSAESILPYLKGNAVNFELDVHQTVTSTNTIAKEMAGKGAKEGTVIVAMEQTEGRGRMGRTFYSPNSSGIYFSVILRPKLTLEDSLLITTATAVAVAKAMDAVAGVKAEIKWVNDIFVNKKKVCGILTEASLNFENGGLEYAVVGIGINISTDTFPEDIKKVAGSLFHIKPTDVPITSVLVAEVLNNIADCMNSLTDKKYLEEYRRRSFLIGRKIMVLKGKETLPAKALDIDEKARLVVEYEDKTREALSSGEVSVRSI
ncbi:biotin--[acetyl-CoA-carboxylase] ligase [Mobilitalea sibirica]|uniref:Bifunctional ligase/repressor BirA n=1 Tax=Mobilitalea sibirica TaxID=1462919 RepID=A0A8J7H2H7_9FIRM|nr:biotin--[acetyl-CoA-carboxylase] ligase [Mobilitalea sibirica]MBH1940994.1 biotin--[acetyl-CoA-carboxylase] ligase [Mobilitalea sibirica]